MGMGPQAYPNPNALKGLVLLDSHGSLLSGLPQTIRLASLGVYHTYTSYWDGRAKMAMEIVMNYM